MSAETDQVMPDPNEAVLRSDPRATAFRPRWNPCVVFDGGEGRKIEVNCETGNVTLSNLTPDEASRMFWEGLAEHYKHLFRDKESVAS